MKQTREEFLIDLSKHYFLARTVGERALIVGRALSDHPACAVFIEKHKDGWLGEEGQFARVLAKILFHII